MYNTAVAKDITQNFEDTAFAIRRKMVNMLVPKATHHIGCSFDIVEILTVLYFHTMKVFPKNPKSLDRDIFILSKGHAGLTLYATLAERGYFGDDLLYSYDKDGGILPEHASKVAPGIELSTGSLGHGLPVGLGFAMHFKAQKKDNMVYVLLSDGELDEGSNWEAFLFAGFHKMNNVVIIIDYNKFQGYGKTEEVINLEPLKDKFEAFHWNYVEVDGHDFKGLTMCFDEAKKSKKPTCIVAHTIKGKGITFFEGKFESHYQSLDENVIDDLKKMYSKKK